MPLRAGYGARDQWRFQWRGVRVEIALRMRILRCLCARMMNLLYWKQTKGGRVNQNRLLMKELSCGRFLAASGGRGACGTRGNTFQGTGTRRTACKMSQHTYHDNKCTCGEDLASVSLRARCEAEKTHRGNVAPACATERERSTTSDFGMTTLH